MASPCRSTSPSTEADYDILTPTGSVPETAKEPSEHMEFCMLLTELERWAPIVEHLNNDEVAQLSEFFCQKAHDLADYPPAGIVDQQFETLERLTKLRHGPLGTRTTGVLETSPNPSVNRTIKAFIETLNATINLRLGALSGKDPLHGYKVAARPAPSKAASSTSTTDSPAAKPSDADISTIRPSIERSYAMKIMKFDNAGRPYWIFTTPLKSVTSRCGQYEFRTEKGNFLGGDVESVMLSENNEISIKLKSQKTFEMWFPNREDARAVVSELAA